MRVVSWNINHRRRREPNRWDIVIEDLWRMGAQVALLQDALPPASDGRIAFQAIAADSARPRWGTAIVAVDDAVTLHPWSLVQLGPGSRSP